MNKLNKCPKTDDSQTIIVLKKLLNIKLRIEDAQNYYTSMTISSNKEINLTQNKILKIFSQTEQSLLLIKNEISDLLQKIVEFQKCFVKEEETIKSLKVRVQEKEVGSYNILNTIQNNNHEIKEKNKEKDKIFSKNIIDKNISLQDEILQNEISKFPKFLTQGNTIGSVYKRKEIQKEKSTILLEERHLLQEKIKQIHLMKSNLNISSNYIEDYMSYLFLSLTNKTYLRNQISIFYFNQISFSEETLENIITMKKKKKIISLLKINCNNNEKWIPIIIQNKGTEGGLEFKIILILFTYSIYGKSLFEIIGFFELALISFDAFDLGEKKFEKTKQFKKISLRVIIEFIDWIKKEYENCKKENIYQLIIENFIMLLQNSCVLNKCLLIWIRELLAKCYVMINLGNQFIDVVGFLTNDQSREYLLINLLKYLNITYKEEELTYKNNFSQNDNETYLNLFKNLEKSDSEKLYLKDLNCFNSNVVKSMDIIDYIFEDESLMMIKVSY